MIRGFLVTFGDYHHLDGLVNCGLCCEARVKIVRGFGEGFVRGVVCDQREP